MNPLSRYLEDWEKHLFRELLLEHESKTWFIKFHSQTSSLRGYEASGRKTKIIMGKNPAVSTGSSDAEPASTAPDAGEKRHPWKQNNINERHVSSQGGGEDAFRSGRAWRTASRYWGVFGVLGMVYCEVLDNTQQFGHSVL